MSLIEIPLTLPDEDLPASVDRFLQEAERRTTDFLEEVPGGIRFIPCDGITVYLAMHALCRSNRLTGKKFCEWGSALGMITGLASLCGLEASGIEIETVLVEASRQLLQDFGLPDQIYHGSFDPDTPPGLPKEIKHDAFDLIYVYPWPGEEDDMRRLFEKHAAPGAHLLLFLGIEDISLYQKQA